MAIINKKLIHFNTQANFKKAYLEVGINTDKFILASTYLNDPTKDYSADGIDLPTNKQGIKWHSIVFIKDTQQLWTHGQIYNTKGLNGSTYRIFQSGTVVTDADGLFHQNMDPMITISACKYTAQGLDPNFEGEFVIKANGTTIYSGTGTTEFPASDAFDGIDFNSSAVVIELLVNGEVVDTIPVQYTMEGSKGDKGEAGKDGANYTNNLLKNTDFSEGLLYWYRRAEGMNTDVVSIDESQTLDGRPSIKIEVPLSRTTYVGPQQEIAFTGAGSKITLSGYAKCSSTAEQAPYIEIHYYSSTEEIKSEAVSVSLASAKQGWQQFRKTTTVPAGTVRIMVFPMQINNGITWYNGLKLEVGENLKPVWSPNIKPGNDYYPNLISGGKEFTINKNPGLTVYTPFTLEGTFKVGDSISVTLDSFEVLEGTTNQIIVVLFNNAINQDLAECIFDSKNNTFSYTFTEEQVNPKLLVYNGTGASPSLTENTIKFKGLTVIKSASPAKSWVPSSDEMLGTTINTNNFIQKGINENALVALQQGANRIIMDPSQMVSISSSSDSLNMTPQNINNNNCALIFNGDSVRLEGSNSKLGIKTASNNMNISPTEVQVDNTKVMGYNPANRLLNIPVILSASNIGAEYISVDNMAIQSEAQIELPDTMTIVEPTSGQSAEIKVETESNTGDILIKGDYLHTQARSVTAYDADYGTRTTIGTNYIYNTNGTDQITIAIRAEDNEVDFGDAKIVAKGQITAEGGVYVNGSNEVLLANGSTIAQSAINAGGGTIDLSEYIKKIPNSTNIQLAGGTTISQNTFLKKGTTTDLQLANGTKLSQSTFLNTTTANNTFYKKTGGTISGNVSITGSISNSSTFTLGSASQWSSLNAKGLNINSESVQFKGASSGYTDFLVGVNNTKFNANIDGNLKVTETINAEKHLLVGGSNIMKEWFGSETEYNALTTKDSNTLYFIYE